MNMTWDDISVKKYIKITELSGADLNDTGTLMEIFTIIYDLDWSDVEKMPITEAAQKRLQVLELLDTKLDDDKLTQNFEIGNIKFEFCDLQNDWIFAKNIDLEFYSKDFKNFAICLAILYYPKGIDYETKRAIELSKLIEDQPISKLYSAWYFFFLFTMASVKITPNFSLLEMMTEGARVMMMGMKQPEKLVPVMKRLLYKKLRASGALTASSMHLVMKELSNGSTSSN